MSMDPLELHVNPSSGQLLLQWQDGTHQYTLFNTKVFFFTPILFKSNLVNFSTTWTNHLSIYNTK